MSNTILSGSREPHQSPILLDLNALYHPPKQPLTALGIVSALVPLFGYGWQAMTQDPETHFRQELGKRINKRKADFARSAAGGRAATAGRPSALVHTSLSQ